MINFVFMLTHQDATVPNALDVVEDLRDSGLRYIGFKDVGATPEQLTDISAAARTLGMEVMLEVVSTNADDELRSLEAAADAKVDWVLGGTHADRGVAILAGTGIRYCPFPGTVVGHPSRLEGSIDDIAEHTRALTAIPGVYGVDLLAYRHATVDVEALTGAVVAASAGPVITAGSIERPEQIAAMARAGAWGFTIGSAIFDGKLEGAPSVADQVRRVLDVAAEV